MGQRGQKTHQSSQEKDVIIMVCQLEDRAKRKSPNLGMNPTSMSVCAHHCACWREAGGTRKDNQACKSIL